VTVTTSADTILEQIDDLLTLFGKIRSRSQYDDLSDLHDPESIEITTRIAAAIRRFSPPASAHRDGAEAILKQYGVANTYSIKPLVGILRAVRADYAAGYLTTVEELIHADLFADFLEMADHLLSQGYKDPAAVVTGAVLEEHLRKLCAKHAIPTLSGTTQKKADALNSDLAGAGAYTKLDQKSVTAWLDLRNKAAHGHYPQYTKEQVQLMLDGVRHFMSRHVA
jgi:hypothetical protein